jgi:hypothetical protein
MNKFDENLGYYEGDGLGFLKKLTKKIAKPFKKVGRKVLPSSVRKIGRKIDKSGLGKIAAGAAALYFAAPLAMGAIKSMGAKAAMGKALTTVKTGTKLISAANTLKNVSAAGSAGAAAGAVEHAVMMNAQDGLELSQAIAGNREFANVVAQLRAEGYSDAEILQHWRESKTAYETALPAVARTVAPAVYAEARSAGMPVEYAKQYAEEEAELLAAEAVKEQQNPPSAMGAALPLAAAVGLFLM